MLLSIRYRIETWYKKQVALTEYVKLGNSLYKVNSFDPSISRTASNLLQFQRELQPSSNPKDVDNLAFLVQEIIPDDSCLIFCSTKKNCENVALLLTENLPQCVHHFTSQCIGMST